MREQRAQGNVTIDGFGFTLGDENRRLDFPHAHITNLRGDAGEAEYRADEVVCEKLTTRLKGVDWAAESVSAGNFVLRDKQERFELSIGRVELPHGMRITRSAHGGVELVASHASLSDMKLTIPDLSKLRTPTVTSTAMVPSDAPVPLRQERLRFLDAVTGGLAFRLKVVLDLPVLGTRTLDQTVKVELKDGSFDFKKLDDGLTWLEGAFLDIGLDAGRFRVGWGVPLFSTKEIISWALDEEAAAMAAFDRIPVRSLADFRLPGQRGKDPGKEEASSKSRLRSLTLADIMITLSMVAPRNLELAGGTIRFGGDDEPGIVDLKVGGALVHPPGPGALEAEASALDMTLKDVRTGGLTATADRLTVGPVDALAIEFDGFKPRSLVAALHRVTATNLSLVIGSRHE